ncbi:MAG TPA: hypothetical protein PKK33_09530, partial [Candidatus Cloacimonadota bacterium]|nr:hypothetical protein [Candidatus Cloacimonadota bacterium]
NVTDTFLRTRKPGEDTTALEQLSIWGPNEVYGKSILDGVFGFASAAIPELGAAVTKISLIGGRAIDRLTHTAEEADKRAAESFTAALNRAFQSMIYSPSQESQNEGWFDSLGGFSYKLGQGIGMLMPQKAVGSLGVNFIKMTAEDIAKSLGKEALEAGSKMGDDILKFAEQKGMTSIGKVGNEFIFQRGSVGMATTAASVIGSVQALNDVYNTAIKNGISSDDATLLTVTASPFIYATEKFISAPWIVGALGKDGRSMFAKNVEEAIGKDIAKGINRTSTDAGRLSLIKEALNKSWKAAKKGAGAISDVPFIRGSVREGTQETLEESLYVSMENLYDKFFADEGSTPGHGQYGTKMFSEATMKRLGDNFIGGALVGGIFDSFTGNTRMNASKDYIQQQLINGKEADLIKHFKWAYGNGMFGYGHKEWKNETMYRGADAGGPVVQEDSLKDYGFAKGFQLKTLNDLNAYNFARNIQMQKAFLESTGITNPEFLRKYINNSDIVKHALDDVNAINTAKTKLQAKQTELQAATEAGEETKVETIQGEVTALEQDLAKAKASFDYHTKPINGINGKSQIYYDKLVSSFARRYNEETNTVDPTMAPELVKEKFKAFVALQEERKIRKEAIDKNNKFLGDLKNEVDTTWTFDPENPEESVNDLRQKLSSVNERLSQNGFLPGDLGYVSPEKLRDITKQLKSARFKAHGMEDDIVDYDTLDSIPAIKGNERITASIRDVVSSLDQILSPTATHTINSHKETYDNVKDSEVIQQQLLGNIPEVINQKLANKELLSGQSEVDDINSMNDKLNQTQQLLNFEKALKNVDANNDEILNVYHEDTGDVKKGEIGNDIPDNTLESIEKTISGLKGKLNTLKFAVDQNKKMQSAREVSRRIGTVRHKFHMLTKLKEIFPEKMSKIDMTSLEENANVINSFGYTDNNHLISIEKIVNQVESEIFKLLGNDESVKKEFLDWLNNEMATMWPGLKAGDSNYTSPYENSFLTQDEFMNLSMEKIIDSITTGFHPYAKTENGDPKPLEEKNYERKALVSLYIKTFTNYVNTI